MSEESGAREAAEGGEPSSPSRRGRFSVRRIFAAVFRAIGRLLGAFRRFVFGLLPLIGIAAVAFGAYMLFFREEEQQIGYRYATTIGGDGGAVSCVFTDAKPRVRITRPPQGAGGRPKTSIAFNGPAGLAFTESCAGTEPALRLRSLNMTIPGVVPVKSERVKAKEKDSGKQKRKQSAGSKRKGKRKG